MYGAGQSFNEAHLPAHISLESVELAAIYDPDEERAQSTREHYLSLLKQAGQSTDGVTVKLSDSAEELISTVDMIDIFSPARYHAKYAVMVLERNVHVMTEKPTARHSAATFYPNDDNLFIPPYRALRNVIDDGMIGEVQHVWITRGSHGSQRARRCDHGLWLARGVVCLVFGWLRQNSPTLCFAVLCLWLRNSNPTRPRPNCTAS